jgi:predicted O-linked N-acetylglucosamine transferase (SPINDLY family)
VRLDELVTESLADYERKALELARGSAQLKQLKDKLAANLPVTRLFDADRFRAGLEAAYRIMQEQAGNPRSFSV